MTTRPWPIADSGTTLHLIGDVHAGGIQSWRMDAVISDILRLPPPMAHIQLGDNTNQGLDAQEDIFERFMNRLPAPWLIACGNHDLDNSTPAEWATRWGYQSSSYTVDYDRFRLIVLGGSASPTTYLLPVEGLDFLDEALGGTSKPCFVACHFPLWDTVGGDPALEYTSTTATFFLNTAAHTGSSADVLDVLAEHQNFMGWFAGHTHSRLTVPGLVLPMTVGNVSFASVNASCIWYCGRDHDSQVGGPLDPVNSLFATWFDDGRLEVRFRNHNTSQWLGPNGNPVATVAGLN